MVDQNTKEVVQEKPAPTYEDFLKKREKTTRINKLTFDELSRPLGEKEMIKIEPVNENLPVYYEGTDHDDALVMLHDLGNKPTLLINLDKHHDVHEPIRYSEGIFEANWIEAATEWGWIDNSDRRSVDPNLGVGTIWIANGLRSGWGKTIKYTEESASGGRVWENFEGGILKGSIVNLTNLDVAKVNPEYLKKMVTEAKERGFRVVVSIDLDLGNDKPERDYDERMLDFSPWDPSTEIDLAEIPWMKDLCKGSDVLMVFHSPRYCDPEFAQNQAIKFRKMQIDGYQS